MRDDQKEFYCPRCGEDPDSLRCVHPHHLGVVMTSDEAARVRARYAIGKLHNPDHDTTSYRDGAAPAEQGAKQNDHANQDRPGEPRP